MELEGQRKVTHQHRDLLNHWHLETSWGFYAGPGAPEAP